MISARESMPDMDKDNMEPVMASTARSQQFIREQPSNLNVRPRASNAGATSEHINAGGMPLSDTSVLSKRSSKKRASLQRIKESLNKTQSRIVELFSRGDSPSSTSTNDMKKFSGLQAKKLSSTSASRGEPRLVGLQKVNSPISTSVPLAGAGRRVRDINSRQLVRGCQGQNHDPMVQMNHNDPPQQLEISQPPPSSLHPVQNEDFPDGNVVSASSGPVEKLLLKENKRLQKESDQLWLDNQVLAEELKVALQRLEVKEMAMEQQEQIWHDEGKALAQLLRECHQEITRLRTSQCELIKIEETRQGNFDKWEPGSDKKIVQEYFASKYSD